MSTQSQQPQSTRSQPIVSQAEDARVGQPIATAELMNSQSGEGALDIRPGQCWVYAQVQPKPVEDSVTVKVRDSEVRLDVTPAEFSRGFKQVVTKEGTKTFRVEPATYKEIEERVLVKPETTRLVVEPAQYEEVQEEVVLEQARTELEPCRTSGAAAYGASSAVFGFCAKEIPARTKTITVTRLVKPETTRTEVIPAEYKTVTRKVVDKPAEVVPVELDDEIETFEVAELVEAAQTREREIPAETMDVNVKRYEGRPRIVARQAVCDQDLTRDMVRDVQETLASLGYKPGEIDGLPGPKTIDALSQYQIENGLASGAITIETMKHLGLMD
ncbi:peptidoglycan-binding domain-containing protein [Marinobacter nauticus]|uniref:peptidoglycan-binding domain-containing protein n=1 Tax=Marinobacter nauticus TaxID=2743 RepID=UPI001C998DD5|nr:peptidoglycan-binding domain-containing protein [Marinobacter nauticus]MBY5961323.1 peptidoglycan-binding protein [Marinobacter nauticus]